MTLPGRLKGSVSVSDQNQCRCLTRICRPALTKRLMTRARTTRLRKSMRLALAPYPRLTPSDWTRFA